MIAELNTRAKADIDSRREALANSIVQRCFAERPELDKRYGAIGRQKCLEDTRYHLRYLSEAIGADSPKLFFDYVAWAKALLGGVNVPAKDLVWNLEILRDTLRYSLPQEVSSLTAEYVSAGIAALPSMPTEPPSFLDPKSAHAELARSYLNLLLLGERFQASRVILDAVENGVSVKEIYLHVFEPTQREIGRLWQTNRISVAQEHFCTAATQLVMSQLYPRIFSNEKVGLRMVATCIGSELHEIGVRMVADFFEMEGWDTFYLGANVPTTSILKTLKDRDAHLLAISATMTFHVNAVLELIRAVRTDSLLAKVKILVGGYPFNIEPELWKRVGADGYGATAEKTIALAKTMFTSR